MSDVNLIPSSEKKEQLRVKAVKATTIVSIVVVVIVVLVSGYIFTTSSNLNSQISESKSNAQLLRQDIQGLRETEINARNLGKKLETISGIFSSRKYFSVLQDELRKRVPPFVEIETFGTGRDNTLNISGFGGDYISIAKFINNLSDTNYEGAGENLGGLFTNVALSSVNLDTQTSKAKFFIVVTFDPKLLNK